MAGHSKFKNIMHRKGAQDKSRAKLFSKLGREISIAVRLGGNDITSNFRLKAAISSAKNANLPKDVELYKVVLSETANSFAEWSIND